MVLPRNRRRRPRGKDTKHAWICRSDDVAFSERRRTSSLQTQNVIQQKRAVPSHREDPPIEPRKLSRQKARLPSTTNCCRARRRLAYIWRAPLQVEAPRLERQELPCVRLHSIGHIAVRPNFSPNSRLQKAPANVKRKEHGAVQTLRALMAPLHDLWIQVSSDNVVPACSPIDDASEIINT